MTLEVLTGVMRIYGRNFDPTNDMGHTYTANFKAALVLKFFLLNQMI